MGSAELTARNRKRDTQVVRRGSSLAVSRLHRVHLLTYSPTHLLTYSPTHLLTYSPTHLLTYSPTHLLTYSPTHHHHQPPTTNHQPPPRAIFHKRWHSLREVNSFALTPEAILPKFHLGAILDSVGGRRVANLTSSWPLQVEQINGVRTSLSRRHLLVASLTRLGDARRDRRNYRMPQHRLPAQDVSHTLVLFAKFLARWLR